MPESEVGFIDSQKALDLGFINGFLASAFRDSIHAQNLLKKIAGIPHSLPESFDSLSVLEKISFLRKEFPRLPNETIASAASVFRKEPIVSEVVILVNDLPDSFGRRKRASREVLKEVAKKLNIDRAHLVLYSDDTEIIFVERNGKLFRLDKIYQTVLSEGVIHQRLEKLKGLIPETEVIFLEKSRVTVLNEKVDGQFVFGSGVDVRKSAVDLVRLIFDRTGFVADVNGQNFLLVSGEGVVYVDRDINYWITGKDSKETKEDLEAVIQKFLK